MISIQLSIGNILLILFLLIVLFWWVIFLVKSKYESSENELKRKMATLEGNYSDRLYQMEEQLEYFQEREDTLLRQVQESEDRLLKKLQNKHKDKLQRQLAVTAVSTVGSFLLNCSGLPLITGLVQQLFEDGENHLAS